jgi:hypothetical protein
MKRYYSQEKSKRCRSTGERWKMGNTVGVRADNLRCRSRDLKREGVAEDRTAAIYGISERKIEERGEDVIHRLCISDVLDSAPRDRRGSRDRRVGSEQSQRKRQRPWPPFNRPFLRKALFLPLSGVAHLPSPWLQLSIRIEYAGLHDLLRGVAWRGKKRRKQSIHPNGNMIDKEKEG